MKRTAMACCAALLVWGGSQSQAQEIPDFPKPTEEHAWLQQLVGEWDTHAVAAAPPGEKGFECRGSETVKSVGGFWTVGELTASPGGMSMQSRLTLGYDANKKKFIGTWIDSMTGHMWIYEGTLNKEGNKLTLLTEGPSCIVPGTTAKAREVMEIKDKDHRVFTSEIQDADGKWQHIATVTYTRK